MYRKKITMTNTFCRYHYYYIYHGLPLILEIDEMFTIVTYVVFLHEHVCHKDISVTFYI